MKIAVIGACISGLAAGRELARSGHHVIVYEENHSFRDELLTVRTGRKNEFFADIGVPFLNAKTTLFKELISELKSNQLLQEWQGVFSSRNKDGEAIEEKQSSSTYFAPQGMCSIGKYLGRTLDIRFNEKVGGITNIGSHRSKKRTWMLNFTTAATENFDAVIIALPAKGAYGILNMTADEREALRLISIIDEVHYTSQFSFVLDFGDTNDLPLWNILKCEDKLFSFISNESKKSSSRGNSLQIYSNRKFAELNANEEIEIVEEKLIRHLLIILGGWASLPEWKELYYRKYSRAENPLPYEYLEFEDEKKPLAIIGGFMNGNEVESAYLSGLTLGQHWVKKFSNYINH